MWKLDVTAKREIIKNRMLKLAQDGYQFELNNKFATAEGNEEAAAEYKKAYESVAKSYEFHEKELVLLANEEETTPSE